MIKVLFVCLGNICRSPMAEAIFRHKVEQVGLEKEIFVDSAATSSWHIDAPPHKGTFAILNDYRISSKGLKGRQLQKEDFEVFDYIVAMDESNIKDIYRILGQPQHPKIFRLLDLTEGAKDVPDPYYTGNFQETYDLVSAGCEALMKKIKEERR